MTGDGSAFGIVYPHAAGGRGSDAYMLELRGVPTRVTLKPNTVIYTSGLGGTFPRGISIGTIVNEIKTSEVWTRTYLVRPSVLPSRVTTVLVLTAQRVTQGTGNVWGTAVTGDSAARRIAAAGDSLARHAAVLEAQARKAALDSVRVATIDSVQRALGIAMTTPPDTAAQRRARDSARRRLDEATASPTRRNGRRAHELDWCRADHRRLRDSDCVALHAPTAARVARVDRLSHRRVVGRLGATATRRQRRCMASFSASLPTRSP